MKYLLLILVGYSSLFFACADPTPEIEQEQLYGLWKFSEGTIDGQPAQDLLNGLYFEITPSTFKSGLLPELAEGFSASEPYKMDGLDLVVNEKLRMAIGETGDQKLQLTFTTIQSNPKELDLTFQKEGDVLLREPES